MVICFTGKPGSGKTISAIRYVINNAKKYNLKIFSNISIFGVDYTKISISQLPYISGGIIFLDEANYVFNSRFWSRVSPDLIRYWSMHRKFGVDLVLTSHSLKRIDTILRDLILYEIRCKSIFSGRVIFNSWYDVDYNEKLYTSFFFGKKYFKYYDTFELVTDSIAKAK